MPFCFGGDDELHTELKQVDGESQVSWDSQKQDEARVARMDDIKEELVKLGRGMKRNNENQGLQATFFRLALVCLRRTLSICA
jgi:hypothetical protein